LRFFVTVFILLASILPVRNAQSAAALERGTAITDPLVLRELDLGRFSLGRVILPILSAASYVVMNARIACQSDDYGNCVLLRIPGIGSAADSTVRILVSDIPEIIQALNRAVAEIKKGNI